MVTAYSVESLRCESGFNVAVFPFGLRIREALRGLLPLINTRKLALVRVARSITSLNIAVMLVPDATPLDPSIGKVETTKGFTVSGPKTCIRLFDVSETYKLPFDGLIDTSDGEFSWPSPDPKLPNLATKVPVFVKIWILLFPESAAHRYFHAYLPEGTKEY